MASVDGTIKIWKTKDGVFTGPKIHTIDLVDFMDTMDYFVVRGDNLFAGMKKGELVILKTGETGGIFHLQSNIFDAHTDRINTLYPYENYLISGSTDGTVKIWEQGETGDYSLLQTLSDPELEEAVTNVSMEGSKLIISYFTGAVKIWDFLK